MENLLLSPEINDFIKLHINDDIRSLALKKPPHNDWPYKDILAQIKARQKAARKAPEWASNFDLIMPHPDVIEQASSKATATFKANWVSKKINDYGGQCGSFLDLTGGSGLDSACLASHFQSGTVIDSDTNTANLLQHNFDALGLDHVDIIHDSAESFLQTSQKKYDLIYIDPARRDSARKGHVFFEHCSPNIINLLPLLTKTAQMILIKTSPMLDIQNSIALLPYVESVLCLEWDKQCKEVLYCLHTSSGHNKQPSIQSHSLLDNGASLKSHCFIVEHEKALNIEYSPPLSYLYDPGPAFMKAGGFKSLAFDFELKKLHPSTHLYTSDHIKDDFPGRIFKIESVVPPSTKTLNIKKANVVTRHYPLTPDQFKARYKIKDGGKDYIFACQSVAKCDVNSAEKIIIITSKL